MAGTFQKLKDLDLSRDEVERLGEALNKEEFRKLLADYVQEIQDPENRRIYEQEITQLEKERGVDITFIHPKPGYVVKTSVDGQQKCFVNVCANDNVQKPSSTPAVNEGHRGLQWALPHTLSPPRDDLDNKGERCRVFDVVFHPDTLHMAHKNKAFHQMVTSSACEAIESNFHVTLDKKNLKFPKLQYKGMPQPAVVRKQSTTGEVVERHGAEKDLYDQIYAQIDQQQPKKTKKSPRKIDDKSSYATPKYVIKHRSHVDMQDFVEDKQAKINAAIPKELIIEINLPLLKSSSDITLDVTEKTVQLVSEKPSKYKLNLTLPYRVNQDNGVAKFDKDLKKLIIMLPVKRNLAMMLDYTRDDSGVESDHGSPHTSEIKSVISDTPSDLLDFRTRSAFLDSSLHYALPEFTCHHFDNIVAFTLNVKNVAETSVKKIIERASIHVKFTSISSSFYPVHYAFYAKLPLQTICEDKVTVETWDNNVVVQIPLEQSDSELKYYHYGLHEDDLVQKFIEEPCILNRILQSPIAEEPEPEEQVQENGDDARKSKAISILGLSYESSGDELSSSSYSPSKSKGILKRLSSNRYFVGRSISESSLDDYVCSSSFETDAAVAEEPGEMSTSLKKTVRFSDVIMRQLYRSNSSILGQKKKNQRKARNKKRAHERRHSESEASEIDDKREEDFPSKSRATKSDNENDDDDSISPSEKNGCDIFDMDMVFY